MNYRDAPPSSEGPKLPVDGGAKRRVFEVLGALAVVSAIVGGVAYVWSRPKPRPPVDYGVAAPLVKALEDELALRPCVIDNTLKLVDLYLGHGNFQDARDRIATFREKCEEYRPLRRRSIDAYRGLNDYPSALAEATKLIEESSGEFEPLLVRAQLHREFGKTSEALADYRKVLAGEPSDPAAMNAIVELSPPCDGAKVLREYLKKKDDNVIEQRAELLEKKCGHPSN